MHTKESTLERIRRATEWEGGIDWQALHSNEQEHVEALKHEGRVYETGHRVHAHSPTAFECAARTR
jgi:hypothetical protein